MGGTRKRVSGWTLATIALLGVAVAVKVWGGGSAPSGGADYGAGGGAGGGAGAIGGAAACQALPQFAATLGVGPRAMFGTSVQGVKGLAVVDPDAQAAGRSAVYQHESWDDGGYLGPFVYDRRGDIYAAPVPLVSLEENPPALQNKVYRIDSVSQAMAEFVDLPAAAPPTGANPFGVIGLAYDCDGERLYAASVAGSTAREENGRIFRIALSDGEAETILEGFDPFGVGVFNGSAGKRLYYGLARRPELFSVALDEAGDAVGEPRRELSLASVPNGTADKIRRIRFTAGPTMTLHAYDFGYTLQVASQRQERQFVFGYDAARDRWTFRHEVQLGGPAVEPTAAGAGSAAP